MHPIKVLIVDDSPTVREHLAMIISEDSYLQIIGQATNGAEAIQLTKQLKPDVISMDVHMPVMNGLDATREIMRDHPTPIVIVSSTLRTAEVNLAFDAIHAGALAVLKKPPAFNDPNFKLASEELLVKLRLMSEVAVVHRWGNGASVKEANTPLSMPKTSKEKRNIEIVAIAASTGGPSALVNILSQIPPIFPIPIIIVQHISENFEKGLVDWLSRGTQLKSSVAEHGKTPQAGQVLIAPAGAHLKISPNKRIILDKNRGPYLNMPSADIMFKSVAEVYGNKALGLILTGMGSDGALGLRSIRSTGGTTIAQDETSCVVFGMPKEAIQLGAAEYIVSLERIAKLILNLIAK